ncbi:MAG: hypothetical protein FWE84_04075 [Firmicutes bacterium]|nr:hypothetical protein [Bacillota bacterium]
MSKDGKKILCEKQAAMHEGHRERLRQSIDKDPEWETFSDFETLEYVLSFVIPRKDTNPIAHDLIEVFGSLYGVLSANPDELFQIKNMTQGAAHFLPNLIGVVKRAEISRVRRKDAVTKVNETVEILRPYFLGKNYECFYMMMLDVNDRIISIDLLSKGVANITTVDINTIVAKISRSQALKIVLAHNHPGGNLIPSNEDIHMTRSIGHILSPLGKDLLDHLIFCGDKYYSFYENKLLDKIYENADRVLGTNKSKEVQGRLHLNKYVLECGEDEK